MAQECCGRNHETAFCPDCGKMLQEGNPLVVLLQDCRARGKKCEKRAMQAAVVPQYDGIDVGVRKAKEARRMEAQHRWEMGAKHWKERADALGALIAKAK